VLFFFNCCHIHFASYGKSYLRKDQDFKCKLEPCFLFFGELGIYVYKCSCLQQVSSFDSFPLFDLPKAVWFVAEMSSSVYVWACGLSGDVLSLQRWCCCLQCTVIWESQSNYGKAYRHGASSPPHCWAWNDKTRLTAKTNLSIILPHDSLGRWSVAEGALAPLIIIWDVKRLRMGAEDRNMFITQVWLTQTACWRHLSCKVPHSFHKELL